MMTADFDPTSQRYGAPYVESYDGTTYTADGVDEKFDNVTDISAEALMMMRKRVASSMGHIASADALAVARMKREKPNA